MLVSKFFLHPEKNNSKRSQMTHHFEAAFIIYATMWFFQFFILF